MPNEYLSETDARTLGDAYDRLRALRDAIGDLPHRREPLDAFQHGQVVQAAENAVRALETFGIVLGVVVDDPRAQAIYDEHARLTAPVA